MENTFSPSRYFPFQIYAILSECKESSGVLRLKKSGYQADGFYTDPEAFQWSLQHCFLFFKSLDLRCGTGICWNHSPSLGVTAPSALITTDTTVDFTFTFQARKDVEMLRIVTCLYAQFLWG